MPGNLLNVDANFPQFTGGESAAEKIERIMSYLFMLQEQLRYTLANLGAENFNVNSLEEMSNLITQPFLVRLEDAEGNITTLQATADGLTASVKDVEGNVTEIKQTSEQLSSRVSNLSGQVSVVTQTVDGLGITTEGTTTTISGEGVVLGNTFGGFTIGYGDDGSETQTKGAKMYGSDPEFYFLATNKGVRMTADGTSLYCARGLIKSSIGITQGSDRRIKNSISHDMEKYREVFFSLRPAFYKMNDGTSDRYHTGFIAQEVEEAVRSAGLTSKDFAALTIEKKESQEDESREEYGLRYSEFVSLNTYMIQQAWQRIEALERRAAELEGKVNGGIA